MPAPMIPPMAGIPCLRCRQRRRARGPGAAATCARQPDVAAVTQRRQPARRPAARRPARRRIEPSRWPRRTTRPRGRSPPRRSRAPRPSCTCRTVKPSPRRVPSWRAAITAAVAGTPIPEAFRQQGITIPAPGTAVPHPVEPARVIRRRYRDADRSARTGPGQRQSRASTTRSNPLPASPARAS